MSGQLYLLPCPISEAPALDALPASTVETARRIDHFLVEAARTARATLKAMGHPKPIAELDIVEIGHDPAPELISEWLQPVLDGADAAVLSESGCPGVADPGAQIAARAHELGIRVVPLTAQILFAYARNGIVHLLRRIDNAHRSIQNICVDAQLLCRSNPVGVRSQKCHFLLFVYLIA